MKHNVLKKLLVKCGVILITGLLLFCFVSCNTKPEPKPVTKDTRNLKPKYEDIKAEDNSSKKRYRSNSRRSSSSSSSSDDSQTGSSPTQNQQSATSIYDEWIKRYDHHEQPIKNCGSVDTNNPKPQLGLPRTVNTCSFDGLLYTLQITNCVKKADNCNAGIKVKASSTFPDYFSMSYHRSSKDLYLTIGNSGTAKTGTYRVRGTITNCEQSSDFSFELVLYPDGENGCSYEP